MPSPEHASAASPRGVVGASLEARDVVVVRGGNEILHGVSVSAEPGEIVGIVGPNGCGKSTLLRTMARILKPTNGAVHVDGDDVWELSARQAARRIAMVLQDQVTDFDLTVEEVVDMGRSPHKAVFDRDDANDKEIVRAALEQVGMTALAQRSCAVLSGGERQRAFIARALAQQARLLLLDEPTNHLDIHAQLVVLDLVRGIDATVVIVLHDLNHAATLCDRVVVMADGVVKADGPPSTTLTSRLVEEVFGVHASSVTHPETGESHLIFERPATRGTDMS